MSKRQNWMLKQAIDMLRKEDKSYYLYSNAIVLYHSCKADSCKRNLKPYYVKTTISAQEDGLLISTHVPVRVNGDEKQILEAIAHENYGKIRGGLVYDQQLEKLTYQIFIMIGKQDKDCLSEETKRCLLIATHEVADGYSSVIRALGQQRDDELDEFDEDILRDIARDLRESMKRMQEEGEADFSLADEDESDEDSGVGQEEGEASNHTQLVSLLESVLGEEEGLMSSDEQS